MLFLCKEDVRQKARLYKYFIFHNLVRSKLSQIGTYHVSLLLELGKGADIAIGAQVVSNRLVPATQHLNRKLVMYIFTGLFKAMGQHESYGR